MIWRYGDMSVVLTTPPQSWYLLLETWYLYCIGLVTIPRRLELTEWQDTGWSSWFPLSPHGCSLRHSLPRFSWSAPSPLITVRNTTSVMEFFLYFLLLLFSLSLKISRADNTINTTTTSGELEEKLLKSGDSHIENLTIQLSVEPLPQPSPLIGTFPHDFQLLPSTISRRSSYRTEGHNYDEQGDVFFKTENKEILLFLTMTKIITRLCKDSINQHCQRNAI